MRVDGEGPLDAKIMFVGEAPGAEEEKTGRPFCGKSGLELNRYLQSILLGRYDVFITNLVRYRPPGNRDPLPDEIARDEDALLRELDEVSPDIIVPLGRYSATYFLGDLLGYDVYDPENLVSMEDVGGIAFRGDGFSVLPIMHPAAGLYNTDMQIQIQAGFWRLGELIEGNLKHWKPDGGDHIYLDNDLSVVDLESDVLAMDTEGWVHDPWGLSISSHAGRAAVVTIDRPDLLKRIADRVKSRDVTVVMHNAPHDITVLRAMGIECGRVADTMVMAYLMSGGEPQGLKPLGFRHCGIRMASYADVTYEAAGKLAAEWLEDVVIGVACPECAAEGKVRVRYKNGKGWKKNPEKCPVCGGDGSRLPQAPSQLIWDWSKEGVRTYQPQSIGRRINKLWRQVEAGEKEGGDIRRLWKNWRKDLAGDMELVEDEFGPPPEPTLDMVPRKVAVDYAARDADVTLRLYRKFIPVMSAYQMTTDPKAVTRAVPMRVLDIDTAVIPMIERMMKVGMPVDVAYMKEYSQELEQRCEEATAELWEHAGRLVNAGSDDQVAGLLFGDYGMEVRKRTKTGKPKVDEKVLQSLKIAVGDGRPDVTRAIDIILRYRKVDKLLTTYTRPLAKHVDERSFVHTTFKHTRTDTGRLSSGDPVNLQNIPARSSDGMRIRGGFVAPDGYVLLGVDYSQIEMRVLAHESGDQNMIDTINAGRDLHVQTAAMIFGHTYDELYAAYKAGDKDAANKRTSCKNLGFGIVYGITSMGLKDQAEQRGLVVTEEECQGWIDAYLTIAYPGIGKFMSRCAAQARRLGYVTDMFGRRRYLPAVHSPFSWIAEEALRQAANMPIQSGAQGILKIAMAAIWEVLLPYAWNERGWDVEPIAQVHDELIFLCAEDCVEEFYSLAKAVMESVVRLKVPIPAEGKWGKRWSDLKD